MSIKLSFLNNDHVVRAETDLIADNTEGRLGTFLKQISEEMIPGETAHLEIEGSRLASISFEITKSEY